MRKFRLNRQDIRTRTDDTREQLRKYFILDRYVFFFWFFSVALGMPFSSHTTLSTALIGTVHLKSNLK